MNGLSRIFWLFFSLAVFTIITYLLVSQLISCIPVQQVAQPATPPAPPQQPAPEITIDRMELPLSSVKTDIIDHTGFSLLYSEPHEQALWVAYDLTRDEVLNKVATRTNRFLPDPKVITGSATGADYARSGYDRGHLAPAADMAWSEDAMRESFYFSNISPQAPQFNRGIWKRLEELIREWAVTDSVLYIVTGPVLRDNLPVIGANRVAVPEMYYKVILTNTKNKQQGIGFIMRNEGSSLPLQHFAVTIDSVQRVTGLDFFYQLNDTQEMSLEKNICLPCWQWK